MLSVSRRRTMARRFFELIEYGRISVQLNGLGPGFNRPDPSYLLAIEEHINSLKADRETAHAMDVAESSSRTSPHRSTRSPTCTRP